MDRQLTRFQTHLRVLHALLIREMITRYGRSGLGYVWALVEPVAVIGLLTLVFSQIAHAPPYGDSFALFYATGYLAFHWFIDVASVTARSVHVNRPLLAFPSVTALDTLLARFVLQMLTGLAVGIVIIGAVLAITGERITPVIGPLLLAFAMSMALAFALGVFNCWAFTLSRGWEVVWGILSRPLLLVSCVFYSFEALPQLARDVLWYNPVVHLVGTLRAGIYPTYDPAHVDPAFVLTISLGLMLAGLIGIRSIRSRIATT